MTAPVAIGIDLGGTNLKAAIVDQQAKIVKVQSRPTPDTHGVKDIVNEIVNLVETLKSEASIQPSDLQGVGIGTPGPLDIKNGRIVRSVNFPDFQDVPLRDLIQKKLNVPVFLDNDGNVAALGEYWAESVDGEDSSNLNDSLVMLTLGTGVGAGVILNGKILHGHFDNAAELGHMIMEPNGLHCPCGQRGCLEQYASASSVAKRVVDAIQLGESSTLSYAVHAGDSINAEDVSKAAKDGDTLCLGILDEACMYLAIACINIQHVYNPARVVLGGGLSLAGSFLIDRVQDHLQKHQWSIHDDMPEVALAKLGYDAGVIGAAGLVWAK